MDISTIFYFPNSLTFEDYSEKLNNGEIASRTIVFAEAQKAIYKGGKKYGGMSTQEFHDMIDAVRDNSWISDTINEMKGDINSASQLIEVLNTSLIALTGRLNTEIINRDDNIKDKIESLFEESEWIQTNFPQGVTNWDNGWNENILQYLQNVGYWTEDSQGNTVTQWSKLQQSIGGLENSVNSLKTDGTLTEALTSSINQLVDGKVASLNLGTTYATKQEVNGVGNDVSTVEDIIEWMYSGFKSESSEDKTVAQLSSMGKNGFKNAISDIRTQVDKVANGDFVAQTEIASKVGNTIANMLLESSESNGLAAMSAKLNTVEDTAGDNSDKISAIMLGITGDSSTANIQTRLGNVVSGFVSTSDVSTIEGNAVSTAKSEIYSAIGAKDNNDNFISLAALKTQVDTDHSQVSLISLISEDVSDLKANQLNTSGFVAKSDLGQSVAELFAESGNAQNPTAKANVVAVVKDNKSALALTADDVYIDGYLTAGNATFKGNIEANQFTTGSSNESGICVLSTEFDPSTANTNKAYFAPDGDQGGITMWFYFNNTWKRLDLSACSVSEDPDAFWSYIYYTGIIGTELSLTNATQINVYLNKLKDKYYSTTSAVDANLLNLTAFKNTIKTYINRFNTNPWKKLYYNGSAGGNANYSITKDMHDGSDEAYYIANVPSLLELGLKPLYLMTPTIYDDVYSFGFHIENVLIQDGLVTSTTSVPLYWTCDTVLWHAAGDPLPAGLKALGSQTPSTSDAFAYAVWKVTDRTSYKKIMTNGEEFCLSGGDGKVYSMTAKGNQYVYVSADLSNYSQNTQRYHTTDSYLSDTNGYGWPQYGYLNTDAWKQTSSTYRGYDSTKVTRVAHIWHTFPQLSSYVSQFGQHQ